MTHRGWDQFTAREREACLRDEGFVTADIVDAGLPTVDGLRASPPPPDPGQVEVCRRWLATHVRASARFSKFNSHGLRCRAMDWVRGVDGVRPYVSNGALIAAALGAGYRARRVAPGSVNAVFNLRVSV